MAKKDPAALVDEGAALLGIPIEPAIREGVAANFRHFAALIEGIEGFDEPASPDPPAVFRP